MYHIVHLDYIENGRLIVRHLFHEWQHLLNEYYDITSEEELYNVYKDPKNAILLFACINHDGVFLGCFSLSQKQDFVMLGDVYVVPKYRKMSVGRTMVNYVISRFDHVVLHCDSLHIAFYEKFGFQLYRRFMLNGKNGQTKEMNEMMYKQAPPDLETPIGIYSMILIAMAVIVVICIV